MEDVFPYRILRCGSIAASASPSETKGNQSKVVQNWGQACDFAILSSQQL